MKRPKAQLIPLLKKNGQPQRDGKGNIRYRKSPFGHCPCGNPAPLRPTDQYVCDRCKVLDMQYYQRRSRYSKQRTANVIEPYKCHINL